MNYIVKGRFIAKTEHDVTTEVVLPTNDELAQSLLSPKDRPYLVTIECYGVKHQAKITEIGTDTVTEDEIVLRGYIQNEETKKWGSYLYKNNYNWFYLSKRSS